MSCGADGEVAEGGRASMLMRDDVRRRLAAFCAGILILKPLDFVAACATPLNLVRTRVRRVSTALGRLEAPLRFREPDAGSEGSLVRSRS